MLEIKDIQINYNDNLIINKDTLSLSCNHLIGIYAKRGSGKTALLKIINQEIEGATVLYNKKNIKEIVDFQFNHITYIDNQYTFLPGLTCYEILNFALTSSDNQISIDQLTKEVGLQINQDSRVDLLSQEQKALFALAYIIAKDDDIILLDDLLNQLDAMEREKILNKLAELAKHNKYIFISYSNDTYNEYFDTILKIENQTIEVVQSKEPYQQEYPETKKHPNKKLLNKSFISFHFSTHLLMLFLLSCLIAVLTVQFKQSEGLNSHIQKLSSMVDSSSYTVYMPQVDIGMMGGAYNPQGIKASVIQQIQELSYVEEVKPDLHFDIKSQYYTSPGVKDVDETIYTVDVNGINTQTFQYSSTDIRVFKITSYYDDHLDHACDQINENGNIYLSADMAELLNIHDVSQDIILKMHVLVPVDGKENQVTANFNNKNYTYIEQTPYFKNVEVEVVVRGIIDSYYPFNEQSGYIFPVELMLEIYNANKSLNSQYRSPYIHLKTNDHDTLIKDLQSIDPNLEIVQEGEMIISKWNDRGTFNSFFNDHRYILIIIVGMIALLFSYLYVRMNKKFIVLLRRMGINESMIKSVQFIKLIKTDLMMFIMGTIAVILVAGYTKNVASPIFAVTPSLLKDTVLSGCVMMLATTAVFSFIPIFHIFNKD